MKPAHILLGVVVAFIWGIAFVVSKVGLGYFSAPQLTALRFAVAALGVLFLPRPAAPTRDIILVGVTVFTGQFLLQFFGIAAGMPAGLTAFVVQTQAIFTVAFAALMLGERPTSLQATGLAVALLGLLMIAFTLGASIPVVAFVLTLASALSWAAGNVVIKRMPKVQMLNLMVWASLVPPIPALAVSLVLDGPASLITSLVHAPAGAFLSPIYLGLVASVAAYAVWGYLLQQYTSSVIAPFALLTPAVGMAVSAIVFNERFGTLRFAGMAVLLGGVAISTGIASRIYSSLKK